MNGTWILASRQRVPILKRFFDAALANGMSSPGYVLVQKGEVEEYKQIQLPKGWKLIGTESDGFGDKLRECENLYMGKDWVGILIDDFVPETPLWDEILINEAMTSRKIVTCSDGSSQIPRRMCGPHVFPGEILRAVGYFYPKGFNHLFIDNVWETLGREAECWKERLDVMVRHLHPFATGIEDDTHKKSYSAENWKNDKIAFDEWKLYSRPRAIRAIRALNESSDAGGKEVPPTSKPPLVAAGLIN